MRLDTKRVFPNFNLYKQELKPFIPIEFIDVDFAFPKITNNLYQSKSSNCKNLFQLYFLTSTTIERDQKFNADFEKS